MHGEGSSQRKDKVFFLLEGVSHCKGFTVMLKQNVAERLFMEGPGQEKGTAVADSIRRFLRLGLGMDGGAGNWRWGHPVRNAAWTERGDFPVVVDRPCFGRV